MKEIKKMSETLTYESFWQLLVGKMIDENAKTKINFQLSKMFYHKNVNVEEYAKKWSSY